MCYHWRPLRSLISAGHKRQVFVCQGDSVGVFRSKERRLSELLSHRPRACTSHLRTHFSSVSVHKGRNLVDNDKLAHSVKEVFSEFRGDSVGVFRSQERRLSEHLSHRPRACTSHLRTHFSSLSVHKGRNLVNNDKLAHSVKEVFSEIVVV